MTYRAQVTLPGEVHTKMPVFNTEEEAAEYAEQQAEAWRLVTDYNTILVDKPATHAMKKGRLITL
ncbi:MAG: hypothetical protein KGI54_06975 [Pseudomonadota bacterium]|nr:hypothetical protein [Pseudomonadota bacterium]